MGHENSGAEAFEPALVNICDTIADQMPLTVD